MKKVVLTAFIMLLCLNSITALAVDKKALYERVSKMTEEEKEARLVQMKQRVEEIKNMDKSSLSKDQRKELKQELKDMHQEAKANRKGGIYLSTAAVIIIILLLIILL